MHRLSCQVSAKYSPDNTGLFPFKKHLEAAGVTVAYPVGDAIIEYTLGFAVTVPAEREVPFHLTELDFLRTIAASDLQVTYNVWADRDGYVGESTAIETAFALMIGKPVVAVREFASFSPDLAPSIASILDDHRSAVPVAELDMMTEDAVRARISTLVAHPPVAPVFSALEKSEISIQIAQLTSKYQSTWSEYMRLRMLATGRAHDELVRD